MKLCPRCQKDAKVSERIEVDRKKKKRWLIHYCAKCGYNYDLEEYKDEVLSPEQEIDKYKWSEPGSDPKYWPTI